MIALGQKHVFKLGTFDGGQSNSLVVMAFFYNMIYWYVLKEMILGRCCSLLGLGIGKRFYESLSRVQALLGRCLHTMRRPRDRAR